ncbi:MAG: FG-GAP repeat protein [Planctomycetes bacterium]|nr:FG-GAP repeat protein [Planctomycetota bacterium]
MSATTAGWMSTIWFGLWGPTDPPPSFGPISAEPVWLGECDQADARFGTTVVGVGDVNGDGFADVVVGAPAYDDGQLNEGAAFLFLGTAHGLRATPSWIATGNQVHGDFGRIVAALGDVNGDGFADVGFKPPFASPGSPGYETRALIYAGSPTGLSAAPTWFVGPSGLGVKQAALVASPGDVNGDGFADVLAGAPTAAMQLHLGSAQGPSAAAAWVGVIPHEFDSSGGTAASGGDVDANGFVEVLAGGPFISWHDLEWSKAYAFYGAASGASMTTQPNWKAALPGPDEYPGAGFALSGAGDVDADGFDDVVIGAPTGVGGSPTAGAVFAFSGSASALPTTPRWHAHGASPAAQFGKALARGDFDRDGFSDVVIGSPGPSGVFSSSGRAHVVLGSSVGLLPTSAWSVTVGQHATGFGSSVANAGDVDGDGFDDVLVGAPTYDHGQLNEGVAFLYSGGPPVAAALVYGQGKSAANGPATLTSTKRPVLGTQCDLVIEGGISAWGPVLVFAGLKPSELAFDTGTIYVEPLSVAVLPALGAGGRLELPVRIDANPVLDGMPVFFQAAFLDPITPGKFHMATTNGLVWTLGD